MKKILAIICLFLISFNASSAKYLIRISYRYKTWSGHGVEMYFSEDDLGQLLSRINKIDTLTERKLLAAFVLPMDERNNSMDSCLRDEKIGDISQYFDTRSKKVTIAENNTYSIKIEIVNSNYQTCTFLLENKFWGSYDVSFKIAGVLISIPKLQVWCRKEKRALLSIGGRLDFLINNS